MHHWLNRAMTPTPREGRCGRKRTPKWSRKHRPRPRTRNAAQQANGPEGTAPGFVRGGISSGKSSCLDMLSTLGSGTLVVPGVTDSLLPQPLGFQLPRCHEMLAKTG